MLNKLKKLNRRSVRELKFRGRQSLFVFAEQIGFNKNHSASSKKFWRLFDKAVFGGKKFTPALLLQNFQKRRSPRFFASLENPAQSAHRFREIFGASAVNNIVERAELIREGYFNLLGHQNLYFPAPVDWQFEPLSGKRSPLKHWKKFDELNADESGDIKIIWELNRQQHFFTLGTAYLLTGDETYAAIFIMHLCGWIEQNPPQTGVNWVNGLEIGFRVMSWLWALHFFKNSPNLSPSVFADALNLLHAQGRHIEKYLSTYTSPNIRLTGEALALYTLGVMLPQFSRAPRWRKLGAQILMAELDRQFLPDGVYFEQTTWYHRCAIDFYTHFLILSRLNRERFPTGEFDRLKTKLQAAIDFLMHTTRPDGTAPLIGDDDGGRLLPLGKAAANDFRPSLATAAVLFGRSDYKLVAREFAEETFWLLGADAWQNFNHLKHTAPPATVKFFATSGYFAERDNWSQNSHFSIIDGGRHGATGGRHTHADALSFELVVAGRTTLVDPGTYTFHQSEELRNYFRSTAAHNTLVIDGASSSEPQGKFSWSAVADAQTEQCLTHAAFNFFQASHTGFSRFAHAPGETIKHTRSLLSLAHKYWIIRDEVETSGNHSYELNFHFAPDAQPEIGAAQNTVFNPPTTGKTNGLVLSVFGDNGSFELRKDWVSVCFGAKTAACTAAFNSQGEGRQEFFTFLLPAGKSVGQIGIKEILADGGRGFVIDFGKERDWLLCGDEAGEWVENELFGSDFRFAWVRLDRATLEISEIILLEGSRFVFDKQDIINLLQIAPALYGRRQNGSLIFENAVSALKNS